jgi:hypothetical protein
MFEYIKKLTQNRFIYQEKFYTLHGEDCGVIILLLKRQQCVIFTSGFFTKGTYLAPKSKFILNIQGGALNRGLKWFFSKNRPSSLIEAFGSPEKG